MPGRKHIEMALLHWSGQGLFRYDIKSTKIKVKTGNGTTSN
jgi:hypothetical protein